MHINSRFLIQPPKIERKQEEERVQEIEAKAYRTMICGERLAVAVLSNTVVRRRLPMTRLDSRRVDG
ncbi:hypothetical protein M6B38_249285 [Iris pallida]|uniref:Uncharacterized protein n=1 Tax=Iris pallida TaxID=29817 RepID=A0AAX6IK07_IRIPA|nr:hypothetical protein M6B38_128295 [Iris pallida]KAJ6853552.1 hypothetical protein M6B38_249285 [Iris pallida]